MGAGCGDAAVGCARRDERARLADAAPQRTAARAELAANPRE